MLVDADIYRNVTIMQILNGKHYNRAIECHQVILEDSQISGLKHFLRNTDMQQALQKSMDTLTSSCKTQHGVAEAHKSLLAKISDLDLSRLVDEFDSAHAKYPMYMWARMYMRQVIALTIPVQHKAETMGPALGVFRAILHMIFCLQ